MMTPSTPEARPRIDFDSLPDCHHMCLIYDNEAERRELVTQYLAAGLRRGDYVRYFADTTPAEDVHAWLAETGCQTRDTEAFGVVAARDAYCPSGRFEPPDVLANMAARYTRVKQAGYSGSRVTGEMSWALRGLPGSERLLEYEIGINAIDEPFPHGGMCQYDARQWDGATLFRVLQVHPFMIAHGQVVRNPFYLRPEEYLGAGRPG